MAKKKHAPQADPADGSDAAAPATSGGSRYKTSVLLGAMLFAPAAFLVLRGNLSVNEALVRFGCALLFAMVGTAVVLSSMPSGEASTATGDPAGRRTDDPGAAPQVSEATTSIGVPVVPVTQPTG